MENRKEKIAGITFIICFVVFFVLFGILSISDGKSHLLGKPFDPDNIPCGIAELEEYPYIYFVNPGQKQITRCLCISKCPKSDSEGNTSPISGISNSQVPKVEEYVSVMDPSKSVLLYDSFPYKDNICIPRTLEYYDAIKEVSTPNQKQRLLSDLLKVQYWIYSISLITILLSYFAMYMLKRNTKSVVWFITLFVLCICAFLGIYFAAQWKMAKDYEITKQEVGTFRVSSKYIEELVNEPSMAGSFFFALFFTCCTLYGAYFLYKNYYRVDDISKIFEHIEKFLHDSSYLEFHLIGGTTIFIVFLLFTFRLILQISCQFNIVTDAGIGPFQHLSVNTLFYFHFLLYPFLMWVVQLYVGIFEYLICCTFRRWVYFDGERNLQSSFHLPESRQDVTIRTSKNSFISYARHDWLSVPSKFFALSYASLLLTLSPIKFIADFFRDWIRKFKDSTYYPYYEKGCCLCFNYYSKTRDIEEVIYYELASETNNNVEEARKNITIYLQLNQNSENIIEIFEQVRNTGDFFMLTIKLLVALINASLVRIATDSLMSTSLYSSNGPTLIAAIIGYYTASIYFTIYQILVPTMGYIYFRELYLQNNNNGQSVIPQSNQRNLQSSRRLVPHLEHIQNKLQNVFLMIEDLTRKQNPEAVAASIIQSTNVRNR